MDMGGQLGRIPLHDRRAASQRVTGEDTPTPQLGVCADETWTGSGLGGGNYRASLLYTLEAVESPVDVDAVSSSRSTSSSISADRASAKFRSVAITRNPFAPVGAADPVRDLALAALTPGPDRSGDVAVDDDDSVEHRFVGS